jgi:hypothetical protein
VITKLAERRPLFTPAALAFLAILGSFASEGFSPKVFAHTPNGSDGAALQACGEAQSVAAGIPAESFITATIAPFRTFLPVAAGTMPARRPSSLAGPAPRFNATQSWSTRSS